ncbi:MAG: hypothetical protein J4G10_02585 [Alphaproteobacteria bacterium]|nr:hypothetical protein [Alphaproteobacteria bacterium]
MKNYSRLLAVLVLATALVGCGRATQVNIPQPTAQQVPGAAPMMDKISMADRSTFGNATFEYMSDNLSNKYHTISIGDYLLGHLLAAMPQGATITSMQLQKFSGKCHAYGVFMAESICDVALAVMVEADGAKNIISVHIKESPGPWISSFGSNYAKMTTDGEGEKILTQIKLVLRSLAGEFVKQYEELSA